MAEKVVKSKTNNKRTNLPYEIDTAEAVKKVLDTVFNGMNFEEYAKASIPDEEIIAEYTEKRNTRLAVRLPYTDMIANRLRYCNDRGSFGIGAILKSLFQGKKIDKEIGIRADQRLREDLLKTMVALFKNFGEILRNGDYKKYAIEVEKLKATTLTDAGRKAINTQKDQMDVVAQKRLEGQNRAIGDIKKDIGRGMYKVRTKAPEKATRDNNVVIPLKQATPEPVL
jgi:hypothetical protein